MTTAPASQPICQPVILHGPKARLKAFKRKSLPTGKLPGGYVNLISTHRSAMAIPAMLMRAAAQIIQVWSVTADESLFAGPTQIDGYFSTAHQLAEYRA